MGTALKCTRALQEAIGIAIKRTRALQEEIGTALRRTCALQEETGTALKRTCALQEEIGIALKRAVKSRPDLAVGDVFGHVVKGDDRVLGVPMEDHQAALAAPRHFRQGAGQKMRVEHSRGRL